MVDFGGWDMPVQYSGTIEEHMAVRTAAGIFDVSHMGEIELQGPEAVALVQKVTTNDASKLVDGQAQYSALTYPEGTFVDDVLVHRMSGDHYFVCVNASNSDKDFEWIQSHAHDFDTDVINTSNSYTQLAIQGPKALSILQPFTEVKLDSINYYWFARADFDGVPAIIARTGYTGEDGFEIYFDPAESPVSGRGFLMRVVSRGWWRADLRLEILFVLKPKWLSMATTSIRRLQFSKLILRG